MPDPNIANEFLKERFRKRLSTFTMACKKYEKELQSDFRNGTSSPGIVLLDTKLSFASLSSSSSSVLVYTYLLVQLISALSSHNLCCCSFSLFRSSPGLRSPIQFLLLHDLQNGNHNIFSPADNSSLPQILTKHESSFRTTR